MSIHPWFVHREMNIRYSRNTQQAETAHKADFQRHWPPPPKPSRYI